MREREKGKTPQVNLTEQPPVSSPGINRQPRRCAWADFNAGCRAALGTGERGFHRRPKLTSVMPCRPRPKEQPRAGLRAQRPARHPHPRPRLGRTKAAVAAGPLRAARTRRGVSPHRSGLGGVGRAPRPGPRAPAPALGPAPLGGVSGGSAGRAAAGPSARPPPVSSPSQPILRPLLLPLAAAAAFSAPAPRSSLRLRLAPQREAPSRAGEDGKGGRARRRAGPRLWVRRARWGPGLSAAPPPLSRSPSCCGPPAAEGGRGASGGLIPPGAAMRWEPPCPARWGRGRADPAGGCRGEAEPVPCPLPRDPAAERVCGGAGEAV